MTTVYPRHWTNLVNESQVVTAAPTAADAGVRVMYDNRPRLWVLRLRHSTTAGNDLRTFVGRMYGYCPGEKDAAGALISGTEGWCDTEDEISVSVTGDGSIAVTVRGLEIFTRIYFRITGITGVGTKLSAALTSYSAI